MNIQSSLSVTGTPAPAQGAASANSASASNRSTSSPETKSGITVLGTPPAEGAASVQVSGDRIELSSKGLKLALSQAIEEVAREKPPEPAPEPVPAEAEPGEQTALLGKESAWESARKAKLDRLEILVRQGQYKIDPFMLDEIAVRMARLMT